MRLSYYATSWLHVDAACGWHTSFGLGIAFVGRLGLTSHGRHGQGKVWNGLRRKALKYTRA